jgi:glycosyltransferase involved in cell wall biosynthesis
MKIAFVTRSLEPGGAERQLTALSGGLKAAGCDVSVLTFYGGGALERVLKENGVPIVYLDKGGRWDVLGFLSRLRRSLHQLRPDVIYSCLPGPNICTVIVRPFLGGRPRLVFRIAASYVDLARYDLVTRLSYWIEQRLARFCDMVISNSEAGVRYARNRGFPERILLLLPNGFDIHYFKPGESGRRALRERWGVPNGAPLIGLVARLDPMKDHMTFIKAAALLARDRQDIRFVCVGGGDPAYAETLRAAARRAGLTDRLVWAGETDDMPAVYNAVDIATCSSYGEGFPNVIGEAMACGTPCVVTDVGDNATIVGDTGEVVPPNSPESLATGWRLMLERMDARPEALRDRARTRIVESYSMEKLVADTLDALERLLQRSRRSSARA